ncbi:MAG: Ca2+/Na+ antiporter [Flavobacteriales bacterium]|jgi:Ca2+/Na+ antiporter
MDELDKLKGAWKTQDYTKHKVSTNDIYKMLHSKSASYVKWIFYISIIEFSVIIVLNLLIEKDKYLDFYVQMGMKNMLLIVGIISYLIMIIFIYLFYKNYKKINVNTDAKTLMKSILNTRKTVKYYIYFNLGFMALSSAMFIDKIFSSSENTAAYKLQGRIPEEFPDSTLLIILIVFMLLFIGLILLIYRIIYGILLRRLKRNYKELEQLDK